MRHHRISAFRERIERLDNDYSILGRSAVPDTVPSRPFKPRRFWNSDREIGEVTASGVFPVLTDAGKLASAIQHLESSALISSEIEPLRHQSFSVDSSLDLRLHVEEYTPSPDRMRYQATLLVLLNCPRYRNLKPYM